MDRIECCTQAEVDAAMSGGNVAIVRSGEFFASGSARVDASGSAVVYAGGSARVNASDSAVVYASDSARVNASDSAVVDASGSAVVDASGSAVVYDGTIHLALRRDRPRIVIGPIGSRNDSLGVSLPDDGSDPYVYAGCWRGTLSAFEQRVAEIYQTGRHGDEYRAAVAFVRALAAINGEAKR